MPGTSETYTRNSPCLQRGVWSAAHRSTTFATWTAANHHRPLQTALSHLLTKSSCSSPLPSNSPFRRTKSMNWQPLTICTTKPSNLDFILYGHSDLCATRQIAMNLLNSHIASSTPLPTSLPNGQIQSHSNLLTTWVVSPMTSIPGYTPISLMHSSIYKFGLSVCLFVCLFVCLYPINVKTAEPIGPKFFVGHLGSPGKVYEWSKFQICVSIKIRSSLNFWKFWKSTKFFVKIRKLFLFCFTMYTKRTCSQLI